MTRPAAFADLPAEAYPFTLEFFKKDTKEVVHTIEVTGPGTVDVPGLSTVHGPIGVRVTFADGEVIEDQS